MKFLPLLYRNLMRKKVRTAFTLLSIFVSFLLFGLLTAMGRGFTQGIELAGIDRLMMMHKVSFIQPLPLKYRNQIEAVEGVELVTHSSWFGGVYQDPRNQFAQFAVDPGNYLDMYPEYVLSEEAVRRWQADRTGAIVGSALAERFDWQVGDRIPLQGTIWRQSDGNSPWEFTIDGIYEGREDGTDTSQFFFHHDYLNEAAGTIGPGSDGTWDQVGWYIIRIDDPDRAVEIVAELDGLFANSPAETKTSTEQAFVKSFSDQIGDIGFIVTLISLIVFFTLLLVAGNTVAQSVRERTGELAVLKTLGFTDRGVMLLVLSEALFLALVGGLPGLFLAKVITGSLPLNNGFMPPIFVTTEAMLTGAFLIVMLGLVTGAAPAWQALRLNIATALRRS